MHRAQDLLETSPRNLNHLPHVTLRGLVARGSLGFQSPKARFVSPTDRAMSAGSAQNALARAPLFFNKLGYFFLREKPAFTHDSDMPIYYRPIELKLGIRDNHFSSSFILDLAKDGIGSRNGIVLSLGNCVEQSDRANDSRYGALKRQRVWIIQTSFRAPGRGCLCRTVGGRALPDSDQRRPVDDEDEHDRRATNVSFWWRPRSSLAPASGWSMRCWQRARRTTACRRAGAIARRSGGCRVKAWRGS